MPPKACSSQRPPHHLPQAKSEGSTKTILSIKAGLAINELSSITLYIFFLSGQPIVFQCIEKKNALCPYPLLLEEPVLFPELLLDTTEIALAIASTADRRSANVFRSDRSASKIKTIHEMKM